MEHTFTQEELREALLAALLDYESVKKTRRIKAVKKALQGTMMATLLGSTGLMAAGQGRAGPVREAAVVASQGGPVAVLDDFPQEAGHSRFIPGAAHFGLNKHALGASQEARLLALARELPPNAEVSVIGRTDATGGKRHNQRLGLKRAQAAADFLALHGVKVKAVGSKVSNHMPENWMQRRVDIVVDAPQPFMPGGAAAHAPAPQTHVQPAPLTPGAAGALGGGGATTTTTPAAKPPARPKAAPTPPTGHSALDFRRQPPLGGNALDNVVPPSRAARPEAKPYPGDAGNAARPVERSAPAPTLAPPKPAARAARPAVSNIAITDARPPVGSTAKIDKRPEAGTAAPSAKPPEAALPEDATPITQAQPGLQRQVIRGATHFAANSYALAWAHKERLIELVRQLPKDAELTVVGRTESGGAEDGNKDLGKLRAITVATFLTNFGVKVKAVGSKESSDRFTGWGARRVDIVVDSAPTPKRVSMPHPGQEGAAPQQAAPDPAAGRHTPYLYKVE